MDATNPAAIDKDFMWLHAQLNQNFGVKYPFDKINQIKTAVQKKGWSGARLREVTQEFLETQKFPAWTVADFVQAGSAKVLKPWIPGQIDSAGPIDIYEIQGRMFWKPSDGVSLPFRRVKPVASTVGTPEPSQGEPTPPERAKEIAESILGAGAMDSLESFGIGSEK